MGYKESCIIERSRKTSDKAALEQRPDKVRVRRVDI